jgi:hypothetical protein
MPIREAMRCHIDSPAPLTLALSPWEREPALPADRLQAGSKKRTFIVRDQIRTEADVYRSRPNKDGSGRLSFATK